MPKLMAIVAAVRHFYSKEDEPLRRRIYGALVALVGLAVTLGLLTGAVAASIGAAAAAVLFVVPAVEAARAKVSPVRPAHGRHAAPEDRP